MATNLSIYIHIPFCAKRCGYCDFVTVARQDDLIPAYLEALGNEVEHYAQKFQSVDDLIVHTIFLGGGTPSRITPKQVDELLSKLRRWFRISQDCEITMEANPGDLTVDYLADLSVGSVNRLSIGVQSAQPGDLQVLDRSHGFLDVKAAVSNAKQAGFTNLSLDLIYGVPNQTMAGWDDTLRKVVALNPAHLSLYALTVEAGTPLETKVSRGVVPSPDDDLAADMYELARGFLADSGFVQYEISNWAQKDTGGELMQSRHNRQYWLNEPYLGLGVGAHGYIEKSRYANTRRISAYIQGMSEQNRQADFFSNVCEEIETIDQVRQMQETMMMGLRLVKEGVSNQRFEQRFGVGIDSVFGPVVDYWASRGLLEWTADYGKSLRLTEKGYLLSNQVFREFVNL